VPVTRQIIGADIDPRVEPYYDATGAGIFLHLGWLSAVEQYAAGVDFIWASPPCQAYTVSNGRRMNGLDGPSAKPRLITAVREVLKTTGKPFVIENVPAALDGDGLLPELTVQLQGDMFGLTGDFTPTPNENYQPRGGTSKCRPGWGCGAWAPVIKLKLTRARIFECHGFECAVPQREPTALPSLTVVSGSDTAGFHRLGHRDPTARECARLFGITHLMTKHGVAESIPPAYAQHILQEYVRTG
jgi:site-specific DNA-cytosine methylase